MQTMPVLRLKPSRQLLSSSAHDWTGAVGTRVTARRLWTALQGEEQLCKGRRIAGPQSQPRCQSGTEQSGGECWRRRLGWCLAEDEVSVQALAQLLETKGWSAAPAASWSHLGCPAPWVEAGEQHLLQKPRGHVSPKTPPYYRAVPMQSLINTLGQCHQGDRSTAPQHARKQPGQNVYAVLTPSPKWSHGLL